MSKRCQDCHWWTRRKVIGQEATGRCHRFPPTPIEDSLMARHPITHESDHCGEFKEREVKP